MLTPAGVTREGSTLGAYRLIRQLGAGGMGAVWLGEHAMLGRPAAIKVLHDSFGSREDIVTRFFNEARAATAIADPGIVQIYDFGHHIDGSAYIVMEMLEGESLEDRFRRCGSLDLVQTLRLCRQVASSLGAAHARGIVHRDLKPDNVFIVPDAEVAGGERTKILDFGIAKLSAVDAGIKTQTSALMGTPMFMSPEQCRGASQVDQRSDVYSLGCMMFQLLTGRPPFQAEGVGDLIIKHVTEEPPVLSTLIPGVPAAVESLIARCLAKDPAQRPASGKELAAELGNLLAQFPSTTGRPFAAVAASMSLPKQATTLSSAAAQTAPTSPVRRRRGVIVGALGGVAAVVTIVVIAMSGGSSSDSEPGFAAPPRTTTPVAKPEPAKPEPATSEPAKSELPKSELAKSEPAKSAVVKPPVKPKPAAKRPEPDRTRPSTPPPAETTATPPPVKPAEPSTSPPADFDAALRKAREDANRKGGVTVGPVK